MGSNPSTSTMSPDISKEEYIERFKVEMLKLLPTLADDWLENDANDAWELSQSKPDQYGDPKAAAYGNRMGYGWCGAGD